MIKAGNLLDQIAFEGSLPRAGDFVRAQRKILNFTLEDLEKITAIDKANLSAYENNKKEIGVKVAVKLGAALNLDPNILIASSISILLKSPEIKEIQSRSKKLAKVKGQRSD
ncbi:MAG TPA: helix-turn-helix transcriptional regulator [Bacteriovoracaceae bacterium]|nr:helix-turn-helix transcriptional regulator [Bacteriovoracaceae bacterium]